MGSTRPTQRISARARLGAVAAATALLAAILAGCTQPPASTPPPAPTVIQKMTDEQADAKLAELAPTIQANFADPAVLANIPVSQREQIGRIVAGLGSRSVRAGIIPQLRAIAASPPVMPTQTEGFTGGGQAQGSGAPLFTTRQVPLVGSRLPRPPAGDDGVAAAPAPNAASPCGAPDGVGTLAAPADVQPAQLLTPQHDVFTLATSGIAIGSSGPIVPTGEDPIGGQGKGIELRSGGFNGQQMHVQVNLDDPKNFGPKTLRPLITIKPIGGTQAQETHVNINTVPGWKIYCYAGDTNRPDRGYWDGWVNIPRASPGFQVIVEVVENDAYFQTYTLDPLRANGHQYFAGADRSTIHVGAAPITRLTNIPDAIGAFATTGPDATTGTPNVITETNGNATDDIESALKILVAAKIRSAADGEIGDFLWGSYPLGAYLDSVEHIDPRLDLEYVGANQFFAPADEPAGIAGALRAHVTMNGAVAHLTEWFLGVPCPGATIKLNASGKADVWVDGAKDDTGVVDARVSSNVGFDSADFSLSSIFDWADPACWMAYVVNSTPAYLFGGDAIETGISDAFNTDPNKGPGAVQKLIDGFDLNSLLPDVTIAPSPTIGSADLQPHVGSINNGWCGSYLKPTDCRKDQDLLGVQGVEVAADATLLSGLVKTPNFPLSGRFKNVYVPPKNSTVQDLVTSHRDINGRLAGLGVIVDPGLINLALRHLVQGPDVTRRTSGLLDVAGFPIPSAGITISSRPEVAPEVLGVPVPPPVFCDGNCGPPPYPTPPSRTTVPMVIPDLRLSLNNGSASPIQFSIAASVNAGVAFDPNTGGLGPVLDTPKVDIQVVGGCQADYTNYYFLSYNLCGRGAAIGTGGTFTLSALLDWVANQALRPLLADSLGKISLPSLDGLVNGLHAAVSDVRFAQRGGYLAVYADLRPLPRVGIAVSFDATKQAIRFFLGSDSYNIDFTRPTTYKWEITDSVTGQAVATTPDPTNPDAVDALVTAFAQTNGNFGPERRVHAKLTVTQISTGLSVSGSTDFSWNLPAPPNPCNPLGNRLSGLIAMAINQGPGGGGGGTCP